MINFFNISGITIEQIMWHGVNIAPGPIYYGFTISPTAATINYSAQTITFTATTDSPLWQVTSCPSWMNYSGATLVGTNTWMLEFNVAQNTGGTRSESIVIGYQSSNTGGTAVLQIGVVQNSIPLPQCDEIWYTSTDDTVITPYSTTGFGANIIENTYTNKGVITFDDCVTSIGEWAFGFSYKLFSIIIPNSVTNIGNNAFEQCYYLSSITIPDSVTSIDEKAFYSCHALSSVTIPESVITIGNNAFEQCEALSSITIGSGLTSIGSSAFVGCVNLQYIELSGVTSIGSYAFWLCESLSSVTLNSGLTRIEQSTFSSCSSLSSITIPSSVTYLGSAFGYCSSLTSIIIPDGIPSIAMGCFAYCSSLSSAMIGSGVTSIERYAFRDCTSLTTINYNGTMSQWYSISKANYWNANVPATVVHCTDGDAPI